MAKKEAVEKKNGSKGVDKAVIKNFIKALKNENADVMSNMMAGDECDFYDTGSYSLNAQLSGTIYGGIASDCVTTIEGASTTGKTFIALSIVKHFLNNFKNGIVLYYESEFAIRQNMLEERGIDVGRVIKVPVSTVEEFSTQILNTITSYTESSPDVKLMCVLDSLGNLSTDAELKSIAGGEGTSDMGRRAKLIKATFRTIALKLGKVNVPLFVTNHTYAKIGSMSNIEEGSGGSGPKFISSTISYLTKAQEKGTDNIVTGSIITSMLKKGRFTKEKSKIKFLLRYDTGLARHYGLVDLMIEAGIWKKGDNKIIFEDGTSAFEKAINNAPEKYFIDDILKRLDVFVKDYFSYGISGKKSTEMIDEETGEVIED